MPLTGSQYTSKSKRSRENRPRLSTVSEDPPQIPPLGYISPFKVKKHYGLDKPLPPLPVSRERRRSDKRAIKKALRIAYSNTYALHLEPNTSNSSESTSSGEHRRSTKTQSRFVESVDPDEYLRSTRDDYFRDLEKNLDPLKVNDWNGPKDPANPQNWPFCKKVYHTIIPAAVGFLTTFGSSIYISGRNDAGLTFGVNGTTSFVPFSLYVLGVSFGPVIAAPCSETYGRKAVYLASMPIFALFTLGAGFSQTFYGLVICRFFAGLFGSPGMSIGAGTIADVWSPQDRVIPMAFYVAAPFCGPAVGPLVGGYVVAAAGWRWTQWVILILTIVVFTAALGIKETYKTVILKRRAKYLRVRGPELIQRSALETAKFFITITLLRPWHMLLTEPIVTLFSLYVAFIFGIIYAFFAALPYIFVRVYDFNIQAQGLVFAGLAVGYFAAVAMIIFIAKAKKKKVRRAMMANGGKRLPQPEPEGFLFPAMMGSIAQPIALFGLAWTARKTVHWIVPIITTAVYAWGSLLITMAANLYIQNAYGPMYGASAIAGNRLLSFMLGVAFPLFTLQIYDKLGIPWATSLFAFVLTVMTPIPWAFYRWGPKLRSMSKYNHNRKFSG